jgi:hypothetical protein
MFEHQLVSGCGADLTEYVERPHRRSTVCRDIITMSMDADFGIQREIPGERSKR